MSNTEQAIQEARQELEKIGLWRRLDAVVSWLAAVDGGAIPSYTLVRTPPSMDYGIEVTASGQRFDLLDRAQSEPALMALLADQPALVSRDRRLLTNQFNEAVALQIMVGQMEFRRQDGQVVSSSRNPAPDAWQSQPSLVIAYWQQVIAGKGFPEDGWIRRLAELLSKPPAPEAKSEVSRLIASRWRYDPDIEDVIGISFLALASSQPAWRPHLEKIGCSYQRRHQGVHLASWLANNACLDGLVGYHANAKYRFSDWATLADTKAGDHAAPLIHRACREAPIESVQAMLKIEPEAIRATDQVGDTPLHWAAAAAREDVVDLLLANGASLSAENRLGEIAAQQVPEGYDPLFERMEGLRLDALNAPRP